jgi:hypothetical protein
MKALLVLALWLQTSQQSVVPCSGNFATAGCKSFNEMVIGRDDDIIKSIAAHAFVCFRTDADIFTVASYPNPTRDQFTKKNGTYGVKASGFVTLTTFKAGVQDDWRIFFGEWTASDMDSIRDAYFTSTSKDQSASISTSEISASFSYQNIAEGETTRTMKVRRSTMRMIDNLQGSGKDNSGKVTTFSYDFPGYCAEYK